MSDTHHGGFVAVLSYHDGSGILGIWGTWPSIAQAEKGLKNLQAWPIAEGKWEIKPLLVPVGRGTGDEL